MNKYMIRCDIEGVTGVVSYEQAEPGKAEHEFGRRMFQSDLGALLDGLRAGRAACSCSNSHASTPCRDVFLRRGDEAVVEQALSAKFLRLQPERLAE